MKTITIQGKTYNLPPLNTGQIRRHAGPLLTAISTLADAKDPMAAVASVPEIIGQHADLLHMALRNEYPHVTLEEVESLQFPEIQEAVQAVIENSGLTGPKPGEAKAPAKRSR
jgi:hypothetical protein